MASSGPLADADLELSYIDACPDCGSDAGLMWDGEPPAGLWCSECDWRGSLYEADA